MTAIRLFAASACVSLAFSITAVAPAAADFGPPVKKKVDCSKPENKDKQACKPKHGEASDDEIYNAGYWMARQGHYAEALDVFRMASNQNDPRILTGIGFATRKLGDVDAALPYYARALAQNPGLVQTRAYLGEAYVSKGDLRSASGELAEIERRCGTSCEAYSQLARAIAGHKAGTVDKG